MEHNPPDQTKILSTKISCCEDCPKILVEELLKMPGVDSVVIDREKNLVLVTGPIDAMTLVNNVAKLGKSVKLLPTYQHPKYKNNPHEEKHKDATNNCHNYKYHNKEQYTAQQKPKMHKNCCCQNGHHKPKKKEEEEHKCEAYVPPKYDERVCRDFYCKIHPQSRKIVDSMPKESFNWFGGLPFYPNFGGVNPYGSSNLHPGWYGEELPPRFGFHQRPRMLPRPFGFN